MMLHLHPLPDDQAWLETVLESVGALLAVFYDTLHVSSDWLETQWNTLLDAFEAAFDAVTLQIEGEDELGAAVLVIVRR